MSTAPLRATGSLRLEGGARSLLSNRRFLWLWGGQSASQLGDRIHQVAVLWWAIGLRGSMGDASWVMIATTLPLVLFSPFAGALADRCDRRRLMLACDVGRAVLVTMLSWLAATGRLSLGLLVGVSLVLSTLAAIFSPAAMAIVPDLVPREDLARAGSLQELAMQAAGLLGPPLGGLLIAAVGTQGAFGANATSFLISAVALMALPWKKRSVVDPDEGEDRGRSRPERPLRRRFSAQVAGFGADLREGWSIAVERPAVGMLLGAFGLVNLFLAPTLLLLPRLARDLGVGARGLGELEGALALGMLAAAGTIALRPRPATASGQFQEDRAEQLRAGTCLALIGAILLGFSAWPHFVPALGFLVLLGATLGTLNVLVLAYFQRVVPP